MQKKIGREDLNKRIRVRFSSTKSATYLYPSAKLLAVLQNRQVTRVGANRPVDVNIRLISATNMPIHDMVYDNSFRQDLLYRINTIEIQLPPLRERIEDIPVLADHFISFYSKKNTIKISARLLNL